MIVFVCLSRIDQLQEAGVTLRAGVTCQVDINVTDNITVVGHVQYYTLRYYFPVV